MLYYFLHCGIIFAAYFSGDDMKNVLSLLLCLTLLSASVLCGAGSAAGAVSPVGLHSPDGPPKPGGVLSCLSFSFPEEQVREYTRLRLGERIADYALQHVGCKYIWGGTHPSTGFDCSGFVQYVYGQFGYSLNRIAEDQALNGVHVEEDELLPGDILCFYTTKTYIGHVGIYLGDRMYVHAQSSDTGVVVSDLDDPWLPRVFEARRIV